MSRRHPTRWMKNRYPAPCVRCGEIVEPGTSVFWTRGVGITHREADCPPRPSTHSHAFDNPAYELAELERVYKNI